MDAIRLQKVEEQIREIIARLILEGRVKDPRVNTAVSITRVELARDGSHARVFVSSYIDTELTQTVQGLQHAAGFIQAQLAQHIHTRNTPKLSFIKDEGIRKSVEIINTIDKLLDNQPPGQSETEDHESE
ncbi:MAG TPA: 30S ribosome-binding factor RbfA [Spirochaetia bacterium]|nr:30S ribosome-binding factor RbfA [Spirochaetales bacterium]HRS65379.1 30S ribosome-binding factor RbfA [Spirochaetia bacterium]HPD79777.1 30S ribosome-binding factor RbfA [Spirochaetales bacterium]HQG39292.1 30S ribosome-binding factor RbfA [Spirochaetales bacterium]HQK33853.1 30S ribosome-binding factor RbfA [Spirochaetales bacterium]